MIPRSAAAVRADLKRWSFSFLLRFEVCARKNFIILARPDAPP
jgi:hypothetical protein